MKHIALSNGIKMPMIGLGVFRAEEGAETINAVRWALENGYRHIDTARIYENEHSVGLGIKESGVPRHEIFLTTKLWNDDIRSGNFRQAFDRSLNKLQTDYLDLYLIHWPAQGFPRAWSELEKLYKEEKIKSIGVSNFHPHHFEELAKTSTIKPMVNQIESHPMLNNQEVIDFCQKQNIVVQAWSPLGGKTVVDLLQEPTLVSLAEKHKKNVAQIILRWNIQRNVVALPKSVNKERIISNHDVYNFELTPEEMQLINSLNKNQRVGSDPDNFDF